MRIRETKEDKNIIETENESLINNYSEVSDSVLGELVSKPANSKSLFRKMIKPSKSKNSSKTVNNKFYINKQYFINSSSTPKQSQPQSHLIFPSEINESIYEDSIKKFFIPKKNHSEKIVNTLSSESKVKSTKNNNQNKLTILIADDEKLARLSTIRIIKKACKNLNINICIIESEDGIESLSLIYKSALDRTEIDAVITDDNMKFLKGTKFVEVIKFLLEKQFNIPIYLVTAYSSDSISNFKLFNDVMHKPLDTISAEKIIGYVMKNKEVINKGDYL